MKVPLSLGWALRGFAASVLLWTLYAMSPSAHEFDIQLANWLLPAGERNLDDRILLLDVPGRDIRGFRINLSDALASISARIDDLPLQIALDMRFLQGGTAPIEAEVEKIRRLHRRVVGACPEDARFDPYVTCVIPAKTKSLYEHFDGMGHTHFLTHISAPFYRRCSGIPSLTEVLANAMMKVTPKCEDYQYVQMGALLEEAGSAQIVSFDKSCPSFYRNFNSDCLEKRPEFFGRTVLIGRISYDRSPYPGRSGTELIAWSLNDQLSGTQSPPLVTSFGILLAILLFTVVLGSTLFWLFQRFLRFWRDKSWLIAVVSWICGALLLLALMGVLNLAGKYYTLVTLPLLQLAIVLLFSALYRNKARQIELTNQKNANPYTLYDVFISYRRNHQKNATLLFNMLQGLLRSDGSILEVFLDIKEMHGGGFNGQLSSAIKDSRIFVAFLTPNYFDPENKWCQKELSFAQEIGCHLLLVMADGYNPQESPPADFDWLRPLHHYDFKAADFNAQFIKEIRALEAQYEDEKRVDHKGLLSGS